MDVHQTICHFPLRPEGETWAVGSLDGHQDDSTGKTTSGLPSH